MDTIEAKMGDSIKATGGTLSYHKNNNDLYVLHLFTATGLFTPSSSITYDWLAVGPGGNSANYGTHGAGGGGGRIHTGTLTNSTETINVTQIGLYSTKTSTNITFVTANISASAPAGENYNVNGVGGSSSLTIYTNTFSNTSYNSTGGQTGTAGHYGRGGGASAGANGNPGGSDCCGSSTSYAWGSLTLSESGGSSCIIEYNANYTIKSKSCSGINRSAYGRYGSQDGGVYVRYLDANYLAAKAAVKQFYVEYFVKYQRHLTQSDIASNPTFSATLMKAMSYMNSTGVSQLPFLNLQNSATYQAIIPEMNTALRTFVSLLLTKLNTLYVSWKSQGLTVSSTLDTYATSGWSTDNTTVLDTATSLTTVGSICDTLCSGTGHWPTLIREMQTFLTSRMTLLNNLYTWGSQANTTNIAQNALGTHAATVGLATTLRPLLFLQPIVTGTTFRTFYVIAINNGRPANTTAINVKFRCTWASGSQESESASITMSSSSLAQSITFNPAPTAGAIITAFAYGSTSTLPTTYADGDTIGKSNQITFTY